DRAADRGRVDVACGRGQLGAVRRALQHRGVALRGTVAAVVDEQAVVAGPAVREDAGGVAEDGDAGAAVAGQPVVDDLAARGSGGEEDAVAGVVDDLVPDHVRARPLDADAGAGVARHDVLRLHEAGAVVRATGADAADVGGVALRVEADAVAAVAADGRAVDGGAVGPFDGD